MKITAIDALLLVNPEIDPAACDSAQDTVIVRIETDEGITGYGEVDATPSVVKTFLTAPSAHSFSLGVRDLLLGEDPLDSRRLWHRLYEGTIMAGRRGMGIHVIGAVDLALWDIRGKKCGEPVWRLLGGALRPHLVPYASILPSGAAGSPEVFADTVRRMERVRDLGFKAAKIEAVCELTRDDDDVIEMVRLSRETLGSEAILAVDVGYRWFDAKSALRTMRRLEDYDVFFIETPLKIDNTAAHAQLAAASPIMIASGELHATRYEFLELMDVGRFDIVQPDIPRAGGITESVRIAEAAWDRGKLVIPHAWKTGITAVAAMHVSAVSPNCPHFEFLPPAMFSAGLRKDLLASEPLPVDGIIQLPTGAGLGFEIDPEALEYYKVKEVSLP